MKMERPAKTRFVDGIMTHSSDFCTVTQLSDLHLGGNLVLDQYTKQLSGGALQRECSYAFFKIHRKTPALEFLF